MQRAFSTEWSEEDVEAKSAQFMKSFYETSRVLGVEKVEDGPGGLVGVTVKVVRRDGRSTGRLGTWFEREDDEWKLALPR